MNNHFRGSKVLFCSKEYNNYLVHCLQFDDWREPWWCKPWEVSFWLIRSLYVVCPRTSLLTLLFSIFHNSPFFGYKINFGKKWHSPNSRKIDFSCQYVRSYVTGNIDSLDQSKWIHKIVFPFYSSLLFVPTFATFIPPRWLGSTHNY